MEGTVLPVVVFMSLVHTAGLRPALCGSMAWSVLALGRRIALGHRISGVLMLTAVSTGMRLLTVFIATPFVFFMQPIIATAGVAIAFGLSVPLGRPLAARLGADLVPLSAEAWVEPSVRRACGRLSLVWCAALLGNAALTAWLLTSVSVPTFVMVRPFIGVVTTLPAIVTSFVVGARVIRRSEGRLRLIEDRLIEDRLIEGGSARMPAFVPALAPALAA